MHVVIVGAGSVGRSIARELLSHDHAVMIIDKQPAAMRVRSEERRVGKECPV